MTVGRRLGSARSQPAAEIYSGQCALTVTKRTKKYASVRGEKWERTSSLTVAPAVDGIRKLLCCLHSHFPPKTCELTYSLWRQLYCPPALLSSAGCCRHFFSRSLAAFLNEYRGRPADRGSERARRSSSTSVAAKFSFAEQLFSSNMSCSVCVRQHVFSPETGPSGRQ